MLREPRSFVEQQTDKRDASAIYRANDVPPGANNRTSMCESLLTHSVRRQTLSLKFETGSKDSGGRREHLLKEENN